jgi:hypothetical protein
MGDSIYLYNAYDLKADEYYILKIDSPLTKGAWVRDDSSLVQIQQAYRITSKMHTTIIVELSLLVGVLLALFALVIYLIYRQNKTDKILRRVS